MVKNLFVWLDGHAWSYWAMAGGSTVLLFAWVGSVGRRETSGAADRPGRAWRDALVLLVFLFAWRWPFLFSANEFNPDESQLIAGSLTLARDPVFWRSVDGTTSGPLNFYVLLPFHWLGLPLDYFTARLAGLLCVWGGLFACQRALAASYGRTVAWLGVLPAAGFFATVTTSEFIHYSSEHLPLLLIAVPAWLLASGPPEARGRRWTACFIAGAAPWAKLQVAPLSLVLIGWGLWQAWSSGEAMRPGRIRRVAATGAAAVAPTVLAVALLAAGGLLDSALHRYVFGNVSYAGLEGTVGEAARGLYGLATVDGRLPLLIWTALAVLVTAVIFAFRRRTRPTTLAVVGGLLTAAAILAVITPRRALLHYTLLLPVPLTLLIGTAVGGVWLGLKEGRTRLLLVGVLLAALGLPPVITRCRQALPEMYGHFTAHWRYPRSSGAVLVSALTGREDCLAIWGWASNYYVETGRPQATRDTHTFWSILPGREQDYHRADYLADFRRNRPAVFIDAVGPGAFAYHERRLQGHEIFPALADEIRRDYTLVQDLGSARIYARNGRPALRELSPARIGQLLDQGYDVLGLNGIRPDDGSADALPRWVVGGRSVVMLQPPVRLEWKLHDDVRQVLLEFGFAPGAYEEGKTNGAEFILELIHDQQTQPVWRRLLDPLNQPADRGRLSAVITLPSFPHGARLVLRTDPGPFGNAAWDWVYLGNLEFRRGSVSQAE